MTIAPVEGKITQGIHIEYLDPRLLSPHPEAQLIPMSEEDEKALRADIAEHGILHPLDITADHRILDGVHRWQCAKELELASLPVVIYCYAEPEEESIHAICANLKRRHLNEGQRGMLGVLKLLPLETALALKRKVKSGREAVNKRWDKEIESVTTVTDRLVPIGTNLSKEQQPVQSQPEVSKSKPSTKKKSSSTAKQPSSETVSSSPQVEEQGKAAAKVAAAVGVSPRTVYRSQAVATANPTLAQAVKDGEVSVTKAYNQVKAEEKAEEVRTLQSEERPLTDQELLTKLGIKLSPYDVWNFSECDERFGHDYPGRIPGQLVAHCLYFWTEQGQTVLDPMAGSGTTIDVCKLMNRNVLAYDAHPCRKDITAHDMAQHGWPPDTEKANLIFWDPPYFKKVDDGYGEKSISRFNRSDYLAFFERMAATIPANFHGKLAFLMSPYRDLANPSASIWLHDYIAHFLGSGWRVYEMLSVPMPSQRVPPQRVTQCRDSKSLVWLIRELVILER